MTERKRSAQQQVAFEADRKAQNPNGARQTIADSQADPEFQGNYRRLRAEARPAGEALEVLSGMFFPVVRISGECRFDGV